MRNELITMNGEFGRVRTMVIENDVWFVGKDIAECLGYSNTRDALRVHVDEDDKKSLEYKGCRDLRQASELWIGNDFSNKIMINESGLYSLVLGSKLPNAKKFKKWVTSEVLPSIRKHGGYIYSSTDDTDEEIMARALLVAQKTIEKKNLKIEQLEELNKKQQQQIEQDKPKVNTMNAILEQDKYFDGAELAKMLNIKGVGRNLLFEYMRYSGMLLDNNEPVQKYVSNGCAKYIPVQAKNGYITMKPVFSIRMVYKLQKESEEIKEWLESR